MSKEILKRIVQIVIEPLDAYGNLSVPERGRVLEEVAGFVGNAIEKLPFSMSLPIKAILWQNAALGLLTQGSLPSSLSSLKMRRLMRLARIIPFQKSLLEMVAILSCASLIDATSSPRRGSGA
ncbi:MAG: hypothetical protein A2Z88_04940 [Omnitrophica WOR_2 bacterium GWA2_47_8]|nr:MAG: hypothetical protein A2Z88_04940 [Omnitrophica WOR_2 bacterium GWA2_47_8]